MYYLTLKLSWSSKKVKLHIEMDISINNHKPEETQYSEINQFHEPQEIWQWQSQARSNSRTHELGAIHELEQNQPNINWTNLLDYNHIRICLEKIITNLVNIYKLTQSIQLT